MRDPDYSITVNGHAVTGWPAAIAVWAFLITSILSFVNLILDIVLFALGGR